MNLIIIFILTVNSFDCYFSDEAPKLLSLPSQNQISEGFMFRLLCSITAGDKPLFFQWAKNGNILSNSSPQSNYAIESFEDESKFLIQSVVREDAGNYSCIVRNAFGTDSQSAILVVKVSPKWVKEPNDMKISINDNALIECKADGEPKPKITWFTSQGTRIEAETLQVNKFISGNKESFTCVADNGVNEVLKKVITIFITEPPKLQPLANYKQSEGTTLRVLCSLIKGSKPLYFQWLKNGQILKADDLNDYSIENKESFATLTIESIKRYDAGNFSCLVNNAFGKDFESFSLVVKVAPKWVVEPTDLQTSLKDVMIECKADGEPTPQMKWISPEGTIIEGGTLNISKHNLKFVENSFQCIADNGVDEPLRKTIRIIVKDAPKIIRYQGNDFPQFSVLAGEQYKALCSYSVGTKPIIFSWTKNGQTLSYFSSGSNLKIDEFEGTSILSIINVKGENEGNYTCTVRNAFGFDSYTIKLQVNAPPKWVREPHNVSANIGSNVEIMCDAEGSPQPKIIWNKINTKTSHNNFPNEKLLKFDKIKFSDAGHYECVVNNDKNVTVLRKTITVKIFVPAKFEEKFNVVQVKRGESARLKCNATGDQPLSITWTRDNVKLDKLGAQNYEIFETITETGLNSELLLRSTQRTDGTIYKCDAENEHGKDDRTIKLVIVEVPGPPMNVHIKEVWSRSASVVWSPPYSGNSPISKYTIQYWRYQSAPHRLQEFSVSSSQTSALIKDLKPGLSYELSVVGENDVGRGEPADTVTFITGEEEPSAAPNDITLESRGPTTVRVTWKAPPTEHWNGNIKGYYVGYRKARDATHSFTLKLIEAKTSQNDKNIELEAYEYFLRDLLKDTEYAIVVKAFNSAGSGPQSHEMHVRTANGDFPSAQQLSVVDATSNTISLRWHQKELHGSHSPPILSYTIYYQKDGEPKWRDVPITALTPTPMTDPSLHSYVTHTHVLQNLQAGTQYRLYISASNKYGLSDPSNIVVTKTEGDRPIVTSEVFTPFYEGPYYLQPSFTIPILTALVVIIIVFIIAFVCVRRIRHRAESDGFMMDSETLSKQFYTGTAPRYMDFDKTCGKPLMMTEQGNIFPTPYASMPMDGTHKPWDRPLPMPSSIKKDSHIYDHPQ